VGPVAPFGIDGLDLLVTGAQVNTAGLDCPPEFARPRFFRRVQIMCGRYRLKDPKRAFEDLGYPHFSDIGPRYNISPTQRVFILNSKREPEQVTWGFVPVWAKDSSKAIINAMRETVREKRTFKKAIAERRCIIPADGFYEWKKQPAGPKIPHLFTVRGGLPFFFAGIWEPGEDANRCCILTTSPNEICAAVHNRMPVILPLEHWREWLSSEPLADADFDRLTSPYPAADMEATPVSSAVSSSRYDGPKCNDPWEGIAPAPKLKVEKRRANVDQQSSFGF